ncbi:MAG: AraC family transcriptional regulator [Ramlibacter sp.]|nr:AraC family transcriptional regulator [Ramlibacter sp.]
MHSAPLHRSQVLASPWAGVYATHIASARHYGRHWHATYGLGMIDEGAQLSASGRGDVEAYAGDLIATNPGEVHDGRPLGAASRRWRIVFFDAAVLAAMAGGDCAGTEITRPVIRDPRLGGALARLLACIEAWNRSRCTEVDRLACEESLVQTCALLRDLHSNRGISHDAGADVIRIRDRLADDPVDVPSLGELATMAGLSKYQLIRRFQKVYGLTPHAWLIQLRAERARASIHQGLALATAASVSGFADQSHMTRIFMRQFGFTPGAWQKAARGGAAITFKTA